MSELLGELEVLVLIAILRIGPNAYGVPIVEELRRHTKRPILRPSVYLALKRLEDKGLVRTRLGEPEPRRGGRARRFVELTTLARRQLRESQRTMKSLWQGVRLDEV
jgi:DNA-binding PadR family transcriptional regulator